MKITISLLATLLLFASQASAQDWPQFRGPGGDGHSDVKTSPLRWTADSGNIKWKTPIDGLGWSSLVVKDGRVWLTTATDDGKSLRAICLALDSGKQLHNVEVFRLPAAGKIHRKNSHASPTPILEDDRVYVHFGTYGTACLTDDGKIVWKESVRYRHVHGPGGSPVIFKDLLIFSCDGGDTQSVVALDKNTGRQRWQTPRPANPNGKKFAFSTPQIIEVGGKPQLISAGAGSVVSYEPATGRPIWQSRYGTGYSVIPRPIFGHGLVFLSSCYDSPTLYAIRPNGMGDVTDSHVAWTLKRGAPHTPSCLLVGDELYVVSDRGIATCLDAKTGEQHWQERLDGNFSASPLYAAGRIYFLDEGGTTIVIKPGKVFEVLARNEVAAQTLASLTPVEGALLLRTDSHVYRIDAMPE